MYARGVGLVTPPAWAMTPAGQAWVVANEQNNVVNPPGTPAWYAWQAAHPPPTNAAPIPPPVAPPGTDAVGYPPVEAAQLAARTARCHRTQLTQTVGLLGAGGAAIIFLPGAWKLLGLLALPAVLYAGFGGAPFRSADCDYGL